MKKQLLNNSETEALAIVSIFAVIAARIFAVIMAIAAVLFARVPDGGYAVVTLIVFAVVFAGIPAKTIAVWVRNWYLNKRDGYYTTTM